MSTICRPWRIDSRIGVGGRRLFSIISRDQTVAIAKITNGFNISDSDSASKHTVSRELLHMGLYSRWSKHVPVPAERAMGL